jgi:hypothetical protein
MVGTGLLLVAAATVLTVSSAQAATTLDGPVDLGTASTFGVLGASAVTNTGPTVVNGDVGIHPGTSVTGFTGAPNGTYTGTLHQTDAAAGQAQSDLTTAFNVAAGLTPTTSGLSELNGLSLTPGVYSGGALSLANNGTLTLAGSASSVWVFQAASTLTIGSGTKILISGGATACNVFWQVDSSATLGTTAHFQGTILAAQSITATTGATIAGRLLASTAAVTLDSNTITVPTGCPPPGVPTSTTSPQFTSGTPPTASAGTAYRFLVTASGTPAPVFTVTAGALPAGLNLNSTTGEIAGTPTTPGSATFTITARNGVAPDASAIYTVQTQVATTALPAAAPSAAATTSFGSTAPRQLAATGSDAALPAAGGIGLIAAGMILIILHGRRRAETPK